jgi:alpha-galactosidase
MKFTLQVISEPSYDCRKEEQWDNGALHITADVQNCTLKEVKGQLYCRCEEDERFFLNGYQTWTVSPEYDRSSKIKGMHGIPKNLVAKYAFDRYADYHFVEYPNKKGITHGVSWCWFRKGEQYRLFASLNEETGYTLFQYDAGQSILTIEKDCKGLKVNGPYPVFDLFYAEGTQQEVFDAWFQALQVQPRTTEKIYGYSSWYNRYQNINETSIAQDLQGCRDIFAKNDLFQIDDGWEPYVGDWLEPDQEKFPRGMKTMADQIHAAGYRAGIWLAPFAAEEKSKLYQEHPYWFIQSHGVNWKCGGNWSGFYSLDIDVPEAEEYIRKVFHQVIDDWGYDLVKLDFLYGAAPFGSDHETRAGKMYRAMRLLREVCGDRLILGCGVPVMPAFGLVDYCRISCDVSLDEDDVWYMHHMHRERVSTTNAITNIYTRNQLNRHAYMSDPDVFFLRNDNIKLNEEQKSQLAQLDALLGGVFLTSDDPSTYTDQMKQEYQQYRHMAEKAEVIHMTVGNHQIEVEYLLDGEHKTLVVDGYRKLFK